MRHRSSSRLLEFAGGTPITTRECLHCKTSADEYLYKCARTAGSSRTQPNHLPISAQTRAVRGSPGVAQIYFQARRGLGLDAAVVACMTAETTSSILIPLSRNVFGRRHSVHWGHL